MRGRTEPVIRNVFGRGIYGRSEAVEAAHDFTLRVMDFQAKRIARNGFQVVINNGAVGRIFRGWFFGRQGSFLVVVVASANDGRRFQQIRIGIGDFRASLTQRREVVENPERASVGRGNEIVSMDGEIANVGGGEIQLQGLPVVAFVEGNVESVFGSGIEQAFAHGIFTDDARDPIGLQARGDFLPGLSSVARAENVRLQILARVEDDVRGAGVVVRGFYGFNLAVFRQAGGRDLLPGLRGVPSDLDQS